MKKINTKVILLTVIFSLIFFWTPLPYFIEMPGTSEDLRDHVIVNGNLLFSQVFLTLSKN
jgi:PDZ domain-containing secreted protein